MPGINFIKLLLLLCVGIPGEKNCWQRQWESLCNEGFEESYAQRYF